MPPQPEKTMELPIDLKKLGEDVAMRIAAEHVGTHGHHPRCDENCCSLSCYFGLSKNPDKYDALVAYTTKELSPLLHKLAAAQKCVEALRAVNDTKGIVKHLESDTILIVGASLNQYDNTLTAWTEANKKEEK